MCLCMVCMVCMCLCMVCGVCMVCVVLYMRTLNGSARRRGRVVSWIFEGLLKPILYSPLRRFGFKWSSSKDLAEYKGEVGSFLCTSMSWMLFTSPFEWSSLLIREISAKARADASLSSGSGG